MAAPIYPTKFDDVKIDDLPAEPQVKFSFVVAAPKKYVWDSWHLPQANGGDNIPITKGTPKATDWPGVVEKSATPAQPPKWSARSRRQRAATGCELHATRPVQAHLPHEHPAPPHLRSSVLIPSLPLPAVL